MVFNGFNYKLYGVLLSGLMCTSFTNAMESNANTNETQSKVSSSDNLQEYTWDEEFNKFEESIINENPKIKPLFDNCSFYNNIKVFDNIRSWMVDNKKLFPSDQFEEILYKCNDCIGKYNKYVPTGRCLKNGLKEYRKIDNSEQKLTGEENEVLKSIINNISNALNEKRYDTFKNQIPKPNSMTNKNSRHKSKFDESWNIGGQSMYNRKQIFKHKNSTDKINKKAKEFFENEVDE